VATKLKQDGDYTVKTMSAFYPASFDPPFFQGFQGRPSNYGIWATCHFVNLPFYELAILPICHFINAPQILFHKRRELIELRTLDTCA
jgi:hypothetical protein